MHKSSYRVGLATLLDPPRPEVSLAIKDCHSAGIKVVMVTGDHPLTAASIAKKIGLITKPTREDVAKSRNIDLSQVSEEDIKAVVVHGSKIPLMSDKDWEVLTTKEEIVFARTSPEQKLIIVKKFTEAGNVCAMTGDGVNDSPALKQAAIGVAMGLSGSDVAREAADLVLLDDNFASIVVGVREGRLLYANLKKSIAYTLAHSVPEVLPVFVWSFIGFPQAMGGILILFIDLFTEV
jgi:sodium/potassium-transporting ATPase subunit alpha